MEQTKKDQKTSSLQNLTKKNKVWAKRTPPKTGAPEGKTYPVLDVTFVVLLMFKVQIRDKLIDFYWVFSGKYFLYIQVEAHLLSLISIMRLFKMEMNR